MDSTQLAGETHDDNEQEQCRQDPDGFLGEHRERDCEPNPEGEARGQLRALHHDDARQHEERTREPREVVVIDRPGEVLGLGEQRHQCGSPDRERGPERKETAPYRVDREDGQHAENHGDQPDQARVIAGELRDDCSQEVVEGGLLALRLTRRRQPEVIGDAVDVVEVGQLVGRGTHRRDACVGDREPDEDRERCAEQHPVGAIPGRASRGSHGVHGSRWALSARTQTVSGPLWYSST